MEKYTLQYFKKYLDFLRKHDLYPTIHEVEGPSTSPVVQIEGEKYLELSKWLIQ